MKKVALFKVEDIIVSLTCPHCEMQFPSPKYPGSVGWDRKELKLYGKKKPVECPKCGERVPLPTKLFEIAG
jgi:ribosomal protein S27AE